MNTSLLIMVSVCAESEGSRLNSAKFFWYRKKKSDKQCLHNPWGVEK